MKIKALLFATVLAVTATGTSLANKKGAPSSTPLALSAGPSSEATLRPLEDRLLSLESKFEESEKSTSEWQTLAALISIGFGALITTMVVFFAIRTERSAATAASKAAQDEIRQAKEEITTHITAAKQIRVRMEEEANELLSSKTNALAYVEEIKGIKASLSSDFEATKPTPLKSSDKDDGDSHCQELYKQLGEYEQAKNYQKMLEQSIILLECAKRPRWIVTALFFQGLAYSKLELRREAITKYSEAIDRFSDDDEFLISLSVARMQYNRASQYRKLQENEQAVSLYGEMIDKFLNNEDFNFSEVAMKALLGRAGVFRIELKIEEAKLDYKTIIERYGRIDNPSAKDALKIAWNFLDNPEEKSESDAT